MIEKTIPVDQIFINPSHLELFENFNLTLSSLLASFVCDECNICVPIEIMSAFFREHRRVAGGGQQAKDVVAACRFYKKDILSKVQLSRLQEYIQEDTERYWDEISGIRVYAGYRCLRCNTLLSCHATKHRHITGDHPCHKAPVEHYRLQRLI